MYGSDVFAVITAHDRRNKAACALGLEYNSRWFCKAADGVALEPTIDDREGTPAGDEKEGTPPSNVDRLVVSFSKLLAFDNLENGLQFGTNTITSHILLGHRGTKGVSGRQCNITVDEALNIWLHDYHSKHGSAVEHNSQGQHEVRRNETWLLAFSPDADDTFEETVIHCSGLSIRIEFPTHIAQRPRYIEKLRLLANKCQGVAGRSDVDTPGIGALDLDSQPSTQAPSDAPTPRERPIYYDVKTIGTGAFGRVLKTIRARDGKAFAAKYFNPPPNRNKRQWNDLDPAWLMKIRREFAIMENNPHPNVVRVFELREVMEPFIIMDYYPLGNITDANTAYDEYITAWGQILDGLKHLHAKGVVHRDLKSENILFERSPLFKVIIADFGMAKIATDTALLRTFCGSLKYAAPEVFPSMSSGHGPPADIFSLGVMVYEWIYAVLDPPNPPEPRGRNEKITDKQWHAWLDEWVELLLDKLEDEEDDDMVIQILVHMIETNVTSRWSAAKCLAQGFENRLFRRRVADGLIERATDPGDLHLTIEEGEDGTRTPTAPTVI